MIEPVLVDEVSGEEYSICKPRWCSDSKSSITVSALEGIIRSQIDSSRRSMWRYRAAFPLEILEPVSLSEGCTPLISSKFRGWPGLFKLEWFSPTGSFKDRGAALMMSLLKQQQVTEVVEDSSGNGGAAIAAYGAAAGIKVNIVAPLNTSPSKVAQIRAYGASVHLVPGSREETERVAVEMAQNMFYASHNWHPFFLQGTKTLGYELWEDLGFNSPDNIIIPTGAGSNILGCDIAFKELFTKKQISKLPRLFAAQPENCCPIVSALEAESSNPVTSIFEPTIAEGTAIKKPVRMKQVIMALKRSMGGAVAINERAIKEATLELAEQGLFVEPTSALAAAAFEKLVLKGTINPHEKTVIVLTGGGLKVSGFYQDFFGLN